MVIPLSTLVVAGISLSHLNLSDRRHSNSSHTAPTQLYRGNLPHYHWPSRLVQPVIWLP
jgi:hypothetical protein